MEWIKKHADTAVIIGAICGSLVWMNGKFSEVDRRFALVDKQFSVLEKDIAILKTVLLMKDIMPKELAAAE